MIFLTPSPPIGSQSAVGPAGEEERLVVLKSRLGLQRSPWWDGGRGDCQLRAMWWREGWEKASWRRENVTEQLDLPEDRSG